MFPLPGPVIPSAPLPSSDLAPCRSPPRRRGQGKSPSLCPPAPFCPSSPSSLCCRLGQSLRKGIWRVGWAHQASFVAKILLLPLLLLRLTKESCYLFITILFKYSRTLPSEKLHPPARFLQACAWGSSRPGALPGGPARDNMCLLRAGPCLLSQDSAPRGRDPQKPGPVSAQGPASQGWELPKEAILISAHMSTCVISESEISFKLCIGPKFYM